MEAALISIIIPVFNAELYLSKCIDSVISQTFLNWELILVNDGSTDTSANICEEYSKKDSRIRVIHKKNGGVSSARNLGLINAVGKYVTFIDSDDWIQSTYLEDFEIGEIADDKILVIQGIKQFYPKWNKFSNMFSYENENIDLGKAPQMLYEKGILLNGCPVAKLFSKKIIEEHQIRFNESVSLNEDHLFCLDYIYHVDNIVTKRDINYTYLYDFQVASLTKIKHSAHESLIAAKALHQSIIKIANKFVLNSFDCYSYCFGPYQLIRGTTSCFGIVDGHRFFKIIIDEYKDMTRNERVVSYDFYSKTFIHFVNKVEEKNLYRIQFIIYHVTNFLKRVKYLIKSVIPRKCYTL